MYADGSLLASYTAVPEIITNNVAPNDPDFLEQTDSTDTTLLATGDWWRVTTIRFAATVSDANNPDSLSLCVEVKLVSQALVNTEDACGSAAAYSGTPVSAEVVRSGLTDTAEYHWQVRSKDAAGLYSPWVQYGSNSDVVTAARDFGIDTTAPTGGTVYDGSSVGVDALFNTGSLSSLSANWSSINANVSGLNRYEYSIGTTAGATDVLTWTNNGTATLATAASLNLRTTQLCFFNVRTVDNAGNTSSTVSSNGQSVAPTLTFVVGSPTATFGNLNAINSYTDTETLTLTTSTNGYGGYAVRAYAMAPLTNGVQNLGWFNGGSYVSPDSWQAADRGIGFTSDDTLVQGSNTFQPATCPGGSAYAAPGCYAPFTTSAPGDIVADHAAGVMGTPISGETFTLTLRVSSDGVQASGRYAGSLMFSTTATF